MPFLDSNHQRAAILILLLGLGLLVALSPYASGLIGGLVLFVVFVPLHDRLTRRLPPRLSAFLIVLLSLGGIVLPAVGFAGLLVEQAQGIVSGVVQGPLVARLAALEIGGAAVGPRLAGLGEQVIGFLGSAALGLLGHATLIGLNLTIAVFILYYLLIRPEQTWLAVRPYVPFSAESADLLRDRFRDVTISTVIGTGLVAVIQGTIVGLGFWVTGLPNALFWGVVTVIFSILPVVGSGLVWVPGALTLLLGGNTAAAISLVVLGVVVVANVDVVVRPAVFRRFAKVHPLVTLIGAIGGVGYFGLLGILIGPLAVSYFFELIRIYQVEYLKLSPR